MTGSVVLTDSVAAPAGAALTDSIPTPDPEHDPNRFLKLTDADYQAVADSLGIEKASIKAVVEIETGNKCEGFNKNHTPIINFDVAMFRKYARHRGLQPQNYHKSHPLVFAAPNVSRFGSRQAAQYARLESAMSIDTVAALEGTFWGMFQIGGFNWKLCNCESVQQFVERMAYSERSQLELFADFIQSRDLVKYLRAHNWAAFALRYNGPGYARLGYHTKMAASYRRHTKK